MSLSNQQLADDYCYYSYYLYSKICVDGSYVAAIYYRFDEAVKNHPAQCIINGTRYPAQWATDNPFEIPWAIKIRVEHGKWIWLADRYNHTVEMIGKINVRAACIEGESPNNFFIYVGDRLGTVNIDVQRSLDDAIVAHLPPTDIETACWDSRGRGRWEIRLGKDWAHDKLKRTQIIVQAMLGEVVQVRR